MGMPELVSKVSFLSGKRLRIGATSLASQADFCSLLLVIRNTSSFLENLTVVYDCHPFSET
jgi:hypothetical protein